MYEINVIRLLEHDNGRRGDLFARLMSDLFIALGYEQPQLKIYKSGREVDLITDHRVEPRRAIAECKATAEPVGGADLNKFVGLLDAERRDKRAVTGHFISLGGFTQTALEQERHRRTKIVLLNGTQVVTQLINGRILVPVERAIELAGRLRAELPDLVPDPSIELLAHHRGWTWLIYYTWNGARTHFALILSDGTPLARPLADEIIDADRTCGGILNDLSCLNPELPNQKDAEPRAEDALSAYRQYIATECGFIQLDGLPADSDVGSRRLRLENLFVPLHLDLAAAAGRHSPVGSVLATHHRLALLAPPGGGKSTLLKRLASAFSDPDRRDEVSDDLPDRDWLPIFLRCRELRHLTRGSLADLLDALSHREPVRQYAKIFRAIVDRALLEGRALLLVDGLDEISDPGDRAAFVCTLRTTLQAYPDVAAVVTSREAGFRHVAAHLAPVCLQATVSTFTPDDVRRLTVAWHREVVGDTQKIRKDAEQLAATIAGDDRIQRLAVNPLLLTTLLLVKRWVGSLPTRRAVLYGKAVEVLLMTWNTEAYQPIPDEEALPQLCYVASAMMLEGLQKISRPRLADLLQDARDSLPAELGYVQGSVKNFISRVEERSSLLMMSGYDVEDSQLVEFFEFRHLTFQEFLTARAMVDGWHPRRRSDDTLSTALEPRFEDEKWREVIPLAAVLGGKATEELIQSLTARAAALNRGTKEAGHPLLLVLGHCLADEAAARPPTIRAALRELIQMGTGLNEASFTRMLAQGRYGEQLREEARSAFASGIDLRRFKAALAEVVWWRSVESEDPADFRPAALRFSEFLNDVNRLTRCEGALGFVTLGFVLSLPEFQSFRDECLPTLVHAIPLLWPMVNSDDQPEQCAGLWALIWLGACRIEVPPASPDVLGRLFELWQTSRNDEIRRLASWCLASQPLASRNGGQCASIPWIQIELLLSREAKGAPERAAAIVVAWYRRALEDAEIIDRSRRYAADNDERTYTRTLHELLERLGAQA